MTDVASPPYRAIRSLPPHGRISRTLVATAEVPAELWHVPADEAESALSVIAAMAAIDSPHIVRLIDIAWQLDGDVLVVRELGDGRPLGALIDEPGWISPGRAVTVLQPLIEAVLAAHDAGVVLGARAIDGTRVASDGRPLMDDLADARLGAPLPVAVRERDPHHRADIAALDAVRRRLAAALERAGHADAAASLPELTHALEAPAALQHWAAPEALIGRIAGAPVVPPFPASHPSPSDDAQPTASASSLTATLAGSSGLPPQLVRRIDAVMTRVQSQVAATRARAGALSRRSLVVGGLGVAALLAVVATALSPAAGDEGRGTAASAHDGQVSAPAEDLSLENPVQQAATPDETTAALDDADPERWEDVVDALLERWQRCRREAMALCDGALQASSPAADRHAQGADGMLDTLLDARADRDGEVALVERSADAAVLLVTSPHTEPASLLVMRGEAGWRVRDAWN